MYLTTLGKRAISFTPEGYLNFSPNEFKKIQICTYTIYGTRIDRQRCINIYQNMREIFFLQKSYCIFYAI